MQAVVLASKPFSKYADTATSYEFPAQYLKWFEPLKHGEPIFAVIYEPLDRGRGRKGFVGWASITEPPTPTGTRSNTGQALWVARYTDRFHEFQGTVPRDVMGDPIEAWLRAVPPEHRDVRTSGASIRGLAPNDLSRILEIAFAGEVARPSPYPTMESVPPELRVAERARRLVEIADRDTRFREQVVAAYEWRCALTGLTTGRLGMGRSSGLIDAAHIRPVAESGQDIVGNGIAFTPTIHRLFDAGLFTVVPSSDGGLEVLSSPQLDSTMVEVPERGTHVPVTDGLRLLLPNDRALRPDRRFVEYHRTNKFIGSR